MNKKKVILAIVSWTAMVVVILVWIKLPTMGESILISRLLGCVAIFLLILPVLVSVVSGRLSRNRSGTAEDSDERVSVILISVVVVGILFLFVVGPGISEYQQDKEAGPQRVVLGDFRFQYLMEEDAFLLEGTDNGVDYTFEVEKSHLGDGVIRALNEGPLEVAVTHYPYSMSVVEIEVHTTDGYTLIVSGEGELQVLQNTPDLEAGANGGNMEGTGTEGNPGTTQGTGTESNLGSTQDTGAAKEPGSTQGTTGTTASSNTQSSDNNTAYKGDTTAQQQSVKKDKYEEVSLEDAGLSDIQPGDKVSDVNNKLMLQGYREELISGAEAIKSWGEKRRAVMEAYDVASGQAVHLVYKDDREAIMIYNTETSLLVKLVVREKVE